MTHISALLGLALVFSTQAAFSQSLVNPETARESGAASTRLDCKALVGQVLDAEGLPVVGATLLIKGTTNAYITDGQGQFEITAPVYRKQLVAVEAAGYLPIVMPLTACELPLLKLERDPEVRIKRTGKRAGQVVRYGGAYRQ